MGGYQHGPYPDKVIDSWDWPAAAAAYKERWENEAHNVRIWRGRAEALRKQMAQATPTNQPTK